MKLILVRHCEAEAHHTDSERKLTAQGEKDALQLGKIIKSIRWPVREIRTSPIKRAVQTGNLLNQGLGLQANVVQDHALSPGFDVVSLFSTLSPMDGAALLVFHAPDVHRLSAYITGAPESAFYFPVGGFVALNVANTRAGGGLIYAAGDPSLFGGLTEKP